MKLDDLYFWQDWPLPTRKRFFISAMLGWAAVLFLIWLTLFAATRHGKAELKQAKHELTRAKPLVEQVVNLQAQRGALSGMTPMAAAQQVSRDMNLDDRLASVRPIQIDQGREGVQLFFEGLNLKELVGLLNDLRTRGGLKVISCNISHRIDVASLADLQLVLTR